MSTTRKTKNLRLRRKLAKIVSMQRKIDSILGNIDSTLLDMKRLVKVIDKIKPDHFK